MQSISEQVTKFMLYLLQSNEVFTKTVNLLIEKAEDELEAVDTLEDWFETLNENEAPCILNALLLEEIDWAWIFKSWQDFPVSEFEPDKEQMGHSNSLSLGVYRWIFNREEFSRFCEIGVQSFAPKGITVDTNIAAANLGRIIKAEYFRCYSRRNYGIAYRNSR